MRVPQFLQDHHVSYQLLWHPPAYSASRRAMLLHIPGLQVLKCVLLIGASKRLMAVLPATHRINLAKVQSRFPEIQRLATETEVAETFRDCEWGVRLPFGSLYGIPTILDNSVAINNDVTFEGHQHCVAIQMRFADFERLEKPLRFSFCERHNISAATDLSTQTGPDRNFYLSN